MKININKLNALIDPFQQDFFNTIQISKDNILNFLNSANIDYKEKNIKKFSKEYYEKKIAFFLNNETKEKIIIEINQEKKVSFLSGKEKYIANILKGETEIDIFIKSCDISALEILNIKKADIENDLSINYKDSPKLNWQIDGIKLKDTLFSPENVLRKMSTIYNQYELKNYIKEIPEELWKNENFRVKGIPLALKANAVPTFVWFEKNIVEEIEKNHKFFEFIWPRGLYKLYQDENEIKILLDKFFDKKDWLKLNKNILFQIYHLLPEKNKEDLEIIFDALKSRKDNEYNNTTNPPLINYSLPLKISENIESLSKIWNYMETEKMIYSESSFVKQICENLNNKNDCIRLLNSLQNYKILEYIIKSKDFLKKFKKDIDVLSILIEKNYEVYYYLPEKLKNNPLIIEKAILAGAYIDKELIFNLNNNFLLEKAVINSPSLIKDERCPEYIVKNLDNILRLEGDIHNLEFNEKQWFEITNNKLNNYKLLLDNDSQLYINFNEDIRKNKELAEIYIKNHYPLENENIVPKQLWGNRDFCITVFTNENEWNKYIPDFFWNDEEFIFAICQILDTTEKNNRVQLLTKIPDEIIILFNAFNVNENYNQFMLTYVLNNNLMENLDESTKIVKKVKI